MINNPNDNYSFSSFIDKEIDHCAYRLEKKLNNKKTHIIEKVSGISILVLTTLSISIFIINNKNERKLLNDNDKK